MKKLLAYICCALVIILATETAYNSTNLPAKAENNEKLIALTFDDGPNTSVTVSCLDILKEKGVKATFFVVASRINDSTKPVMQRIVDEGHQIGLHSWGHITMGNYTIEQVNDDIDKCQKAIYESCGVMANVMRLPSFISPCVAVARQIRYPLIGQCGYGSPTLVGTDGGFVLMHCDTTNQSKNDITNLSNTIDNLRNQGFTFVTADEMLQRKGTTISYGNQIGVATTPSSTLPTYNTTVKPDDSGILLDFDDKMYSSIKYNQNYGDFKGTVVSEEGNSYSGNSLKFVYNSIMANTVWCSVGITDILARGFTSNAQGLRFWAKAAPGETVKFQNIGVSYSQIKFPRSMSFNITDEGKFYDIPFSKIGIFANDYVGDYNFFNFYTDLKTNAGKTVYFDNIEIYGVGTPVTTTIHNAYQPNTSSTSNTQSSSGSTVTLSTTKSSYTTTTTTTASTASTTIPNGKNGSALLYTMDEGSIPLSYGITNRTTYDIINLNDGVFNNILRYKRQQDQAAFFKLPAGIYTAYGIPKSISFDACCDTGSLDLYSQISMNSIATNSINSSILTLRTLSSTWSNYSIDLSSNLGLAAVDNNYLYVNIRFPYSTSNTASYLYIDNITLNYEETTEKCKVTIDNKDTIVEKGTQFTFPASSEKGFIAYTNGSDYYNVGDKITADKDLSFTTVYIGEVKMSNGAAMRLNEVTGLRFYTNIDTDKLDALKSNGFTVNSGTLIAPQNLLGADELTLSVPEKTTLNPNGKCINVNYQSSSYFTDATINFKGIVGSIVNIKENNANRKFIGRGYITVSKGDFEKTIYADYSNSDIANNTRTISFVASKIKADSNEYNSLLDHKRTIVDFWSGKFAS